MKDIELNILCLFIFHFPNKFCSSRSKPEFLEKLALYRYIFLGNVLRWRRTDRNFFRGYTTRLQAEHLGQVLKNPTSGLGGDATTRLLQCWVMSNSRLCFWQNEIIFGRTHLYIERNLYARFRQNSTSGFGGDAIKVKIKDGWRLAAESYHGCYGIAGFKACKTNFT